jgi:hypothetical protein
MPPGQRGTPIAGVGVPAARLCAAEDCEAQAVSPQMPGERQTSRGVLAHKSVLQSCHQGHAGDKHNDYSYAQVWPRVQRYLQPQ